MTEYAESHRDDLYWRYDTGYEDALERLEIAKQTHEKKWIPMFQQKLHVATVFEIPDLVENSSRILNDVKSDHNILRDFWYIVEAWTNWYEIVEAIAWVDVDASKLGLEVAKLRDALSKVPEKLHKSDAFLGHACTLKDFATVCPIIGDLKSDAMRPRHWKQLMSVLKTRFTPPFKDPKLPLGIILKQKIKENMEAVLGVVETSVKEAKIEHTLRRLRKTWSEIVFEETRHVDVNATSLILLRMSSDDDAILENDRMTIRSAYRVSSTLHIRTRESLFFFFYHSLMILTHITPCTYLKHLNINNSNSQVHWRLDFTNTLRRSCTDGEKHWTHFEISQIVLRESRTCGNI